MPGCHQYVKVSDTQKLVASAVGIEGTQESAAEPRREFGGREKKAGWVGAGVVDELGADLREDFIGKTGDLGIGGAVARRGGGAERDDGGEAGR
jgi:hypothetical protein